MELLNTRDVAAELGLSERTLESWRWKGEGPPFLRVGRRRVVYTREDLRDWLVRQRRDPAARPLAGARSRRPTPSRTP